MARLASGGPPEGRSVLALLRALVALILTLAILTFVLYSGYLSYTDLAPEEVSVTPAEIEVDRTGRSVRYGRSVLGREGSLWLLRLEGTPEEIGDAHGHLAARLWSQLDRRVSELLDHRYAAWLDRWTAAMVMRWDFREADEGISAPQRRELAALAAALPEADGERLSSYHRMFLEQSFVELSRRLDDVLLEGSMFAAAARPKGGGERGNLVIGRSFFADLGPDVEPDRVVFFVHPDGKYPFASVGWPGLLGVVTGINARGIFVALDPTRTDDPLEAGVPLPLLLRQVLEDADTLEQALEILQGAAVRTSGAVLVGDGRQRRAVVVELSRDKDERKPRGEDQAIVWATDHMIREQIGRAHV